MPLNLVLLVVVRLIPRMVLAVVPGSELARMPTTRPTATARHMKSPEIEPVADSPACVGRWVSTTSQSVPAGIASFGVDPDHCVELRKRFRTRQTPRRSGGFEFSGSVLCDRLCQLLVPDEVFRDGV